MNMQYSVSQGLPGSCKCWLLGWTAEKQHMPVTKFQRTELCATEFQEGTEVGLIDSHFQERGFAFESLVI